MAGTSARPNKAHFQCAERIKGHDTYLISWLDEGPGGPLKIEHRVHRGGTEGTEKKERCLRRGWALCRSRVVRNPCSGEGLDSRVRGSDRHGGGAPLAQCSL